jgi:hypothetical protein
MLKNSCQIQAKMGSSHTFVRINPRNNKESVPNLEISGSEVTILQQNPLPNTTDIQRALQGKLSRNRPQTSAAYIITNTNMHSKRSLGFQN